MLPPCRRQQRHLQRVGRAPWARHPAAAARLLRQPRATRRLQYPRRPGHAYRRATRRPARAAGVLWPQHGGDPGLRSGTPAGAGQPVAGGTPVRLWATRAAVGRAACAGSPAGRSRFYRGFARLRRGACCIRWQQPPAAQPGAGDSRRSGIGRNLRFYPHPPLQCPITAIHATDDRVVVADELMAWQHRTCAAFEFQACDGGHFFHVEQPQRLVDLLQRSFARPLDRSVACAPSH